MSEKEGQAISNGFPPAERGVGTGKEMMEASSLLSLFESASSSSSSSWVSSIGGCGERCRRVVNEI